MKLQWTVILAPSVIVVWVIAACIGWLLPLAEVQLPLALLPPNADAWLGRDALGKSLSVLLLGGATTAGVIGATSVLLAGSFGVLVGVLAGLRGGKIDLLLMRFIDILLAFPGILLAIAVTAALGPSTKNIILVLTFLGWTGFARLARGQTLQIKQQSYIQSLVCQGAGGFRIALLHVLPNLLGPVLVQATFAVAGAIIAESSLSFLGLGDPTQPSWGGLLSEGVRYLRDAPHLSILPGMAISSVVLALNIAGDQLAAYVDPITRKN